MGNKHREESYAGFGDKVSGAAGGLLPDSAAASTEVINLEAILNLPKGTEHFLTDIHREYRRSPTY